MKYKSGKKMSQMYSKHKVIVAGAGGIGRAVALILAERPELDTDIFIGDLNLEASKSVAEWVISGTSTLSVVEGFQIPLKGETEEMSYIFGSADIILDCLPGSEAPRLATLAMKYKLHYVNLTEYVKETSQILEMAKNADTGFILQTGLAPGYINVLAHSLYKQFVSRYGTDVDSVEMKVGALTKTAKSPHYYGFTWSPIGVATEYVKDSIVIQEGRKCRVPALSQTTELILDGVLYEDDFTSGGAADLPDYFEGKVHSLSYKTIRYPGHYAWVKKLVSELTAEDSLESELLSKMEKSVPHVEDDFIIYYASITGRDHQGVLHMIEKCNRIEAMKIGNYKLKAIQVSTAVPMLESARMLLSGKYKGTILQSQIDVDDFLNGPFVQMVYGNRKSSERYKADLV